MGILLTHLRKLENGYLVIVQVSVLNLLGQEVMSVKSHDTQMQIDLGNLPTGTYLVKVASEATQKIIKVIKNE